MSRVYNFAAGPAVLPEEVLKEAASEMLDYKGTGMSVMEMSHRSKAFEEIIQEAEQDLRELMNIPDNYKVLFLQGGASTQFAMVPMNLMRNRVADYIITGQWAKKAAAEAKRYGKVNELASSADKTFSYIPDVSKIKVSDDADYVYICHNNTIYGTTYHKLPDTKGKILVADMSSDILSEPIDVTKYGLIFAGVQKNIGPAGTVVVIIREDLITEDVLEGTPTMLQYKIHADNKSLYNTPPAYGIYICGLVVHSGSRHLGKEVTEYYLKMGQKHLKTKGIEIPYETTYLEEELMDAYLHDLAIVQEFASMNREIILAEITKHMKWKILDSYSCIHNYVDFRLDTPILRKGAISAQKDEPVIIPINMRDGILLGKGLGNADWNYSAPHGAGRIMKREDVKANYTVSNFKSAMKGIYSSCINKETLNEAPFAYRDLDSIQDAIQETVAIEKVIKPIYNFKAGN